MNFVLCSCVLSPYWVYSFSFCGLLFYLQKKTYYQSVCIQLWKVSEKKMKNAAEVLFSLHLFAWRAKQIHKGSRSSSWDWNDKNNKMYANLSWILIVNILCMHRWNPFMEIFLLSSFYPIYSRFLSIFYFFFSPFALSLSVWIPK
jgi:hypothetical protein